MIYLGAFLCLLAMAMLIVEERTFRARRRRCETAAKAEGVVTRIGRRGHLSRNEPTSSDRYRTVPVIRFRAANGVEYEFDAPRAPKSAGTKVQVAYDPGMPSTAELVVTARQVGCAALMGAIGIALILFALFYSTSPA